MSRTQFFFPPLKKFQDGRELVTYDKKIRLSPSKNWSKYVRSDWNGEKWLLIDQRAEELNMNRSAVTLILIRDLNMKKKSVPEWYWKPQWHAKNYKKINFLDLSARFLEELDLFGRAVIGVETWVFPIAGVEVESPLSSHIFQCFRSIAHAGSNLITCNCLSFRWSMCHEIHSAVPC